jgi:hypothetical protein
VHLIQDAWFSLKRNQAILFLFLACSFTLTFVEVLVRRGMLLVIDYNNPPAWEPLYNTGMYLADAAVWSALQAVVFAHLGKSIDRPFWRSTGGRDALHRFFMTWLIINLTFNSVDALMMNAALTSNHELFYFLLVVLLVLSLLYVPAAACVMYYGRLVWAELDRTLQPMVAQIHLVVFVMAILFAQYVMMFVGQFGYNAPAKSLLEPALYFALLSVPLALLECLAFAAMWRICMIHRDAHHEESDPYDF